MIDDLGIRTLQFANGVLLNIKQTDFEDNRVRYSLRIDGGESAFRQAERDAGTADVGRVLRAADWRRMISRICAGFSAGTTVCAVVRRRGRLFRRHMARLRLPISTASCKCSRLTRSIPATATARSACSADRYPNIMPRSMPHRGLH